MARQRQRQRPPEQRQQRRSRLDDLRRRPLVDGADPILLGKVLAAEGATVFAKGLRAGDPPFLRE